MRRLVAALAVGLLTGASVAQPAPTHAALVHATISLTSSPNPSVTTTTIKIVIKFDAPVSNIKFWLERQGGYHGPNECTPDCNFYSLAGFPTWEMAEASGTVTATFLTDAIPGATDVLWWDGFSADYTTLREKHPTVTTSLSRSPTGVVMPGDTVHVTVTSTSNATGLRSPHITDLPDGVSEPTNLPADASYQPTDHLIYVPELLLNPTDSYSFDVVVTAAIGTKLVFTGKLYAYDPGSSMSFTVGVAATPKPVATPKATAKPPTRTAGPSVTSTASAPSPSPSASAAEPSTSGAPIPSGTLSPTVAPATSDPSVAATAAPGRATAREDLGASFALGLMVVLGVGLGGLIVARLITRRLHSRGQEPP